MGISGPLVMARQNNWPDNCRARASEIMRIIESTPSTRGAPTSTAPRGPNAQQMADLDCRASAKHHTARILRRDCDMIELELQHVRCRRHYSMLTKDLEKARAAAEYAEAEAAAATECMTTVWGLGGIEKQQRVTNARLEPRAPPLPCLQESAMKWPMSR